MLRKLLALLLTVAYVLAGYVLLTRPPEALAADQEQAEFLLLWVMAPVYCLLSGVLLGGEWRAWWWLPLAYGAIYLCSCGFVPQLRLENENDAYLNLFAYGGATIAGLALGANLWRLPPGGRSPQESQREKDFWRAKGKLTKREKTIIKMRRKKIKQLEAEVENDSGQQGKRAENCYFLYQEYHTGKSVPADKEKAVRYLFEAVKAGSDEGREALQAFNFNGIEGEYERGKRIFLAATAVDMGKKTLAMAEKTERESIESGVEFGLEALQKIKREAREQIASESEKLKNL